MITCALTREQLETLALAALARELGDDKAALRFLDAYNECAHRGREIPDNGDIEIVSRLRGRKGRPRLKQDPDAGAIRIMDARSRGKGECRAETLAHFVLLNFTRYRSSNKFEVGESDIKRLAAKWKAKPKI